MTFVKWDKDKIKSILPHREPFLFIDEILDIDGTTKVKALKIIKESDNYFNGHFPGNPVMPGVLIIEAMAQAALVLYSVVKPEIAQTHPDYYLGKVKVEFLSPVYPGDRLIIEAVRVKISDEAGVVDSSARVEDKIIAKANLIFGIRKK